MPGKAYLRGGCAVLALLMIATQPIDASAQTSAPTANVREGGVILELRIDGAERIDAETVRSYLAIQPGDAFANDKLDKSLKTLFATGLFADVTLVRTGDVLTVKVVENPIINRIAYEGNSKFDDDKLNDEVQLKPRAVYTRTKVQADVKRILDMYRRSGRFAATVEPKVIQLPQNRVDLVFEINEGKSTQINSINFVGNNVFSNDELLGVTSTKESRWYRFLSSDDTYDPDRLTYDRELLRKFYLAKGYADFRVISGVAELTPSRDGFIITYTVEEGERYHLGKVDMNVGLKDLTPADLMPLVPMQEGDWYNGQLVEDTVAKLTAAVGDKGYAFLDIRPLVKRNKDTHTIDVTFDIAEGPRVYIERIDIAGNVRTLDRVIRREFRVAEGDAFNTSKIKRSETNLKNLGFFKKVEVTNVQGSTPDKTVVNVSVEEQSTGQLSIGAGYSSSLGILGSVGIEEKNFLGRGQDVKISGSLSQYNRLLDLSFTEPYFLGRPIAAGVDIFDTQQNNQQLATYDLSSLGLTTRLGFDVLEDVRDTLRYTIRSDQVTNVSSNSPYIDNSGGTRVESVVGQTLVWDRRDNRLLPHAGFYISLDESIAGLGGSVFYVKSVLGGGYYYEIAPDWVLGSTIELADVHGLDQSVGIYDRFFVGGQNLRGFANAGIGPRDENTRDSLGGNQYYLGSFQLSVPLGLPEDLGVSTHLFTDYGSLWGINVAPVKTSPLFDTNTLRLSSGMGVSWKSPMGPIQIDFGVPLLKGQYDQREIVQVNFGTHF